MSRKFKALALVVAQALDDKKASAITLLHVSKESPLTDFLLIATCLSGPHIDALEQESKKTAKESGFLCLHQTRPASDQWRILDFGGLMIHLMDETARQLYALEKLYPNSPLLEREDGNTKIIRRRKTAAA